MAADDKNAAKISGELHAKENQLEKYANTPELAAAQKNFTSLSKTREALAKCNYNLEKGNKFTRENKNALENARKAKDFATTAVAKLEVELDDLKKDIPEEYSTDADKAKLDADLAVADKESAELNNAWENAQKIFNSARETRSAAVATLNSAKKTFAELQSELKDKTEPDIDKLKQNAEIASDKYGTALNEKSKLEIKFDTLKKISIKLADIRKKLADEQKIAEIWRRLSDVANATGKGESELKISFQRYYLSTMFDEVVSEANNCLKKMSNGRYLFRMKDAGKTKAKSAGLNLEIFDEYTGSLRPVETLSGGESFLASLSLALGLAAVVQNNSGGIKLDTIFIDEGFGTLDTETLDFAMKTLIELQDGGRLVGIISHVEELKNQISVRLEVKKEKFGSSAKFF